MAEDSDLERTEKATGRRIQQARQQGQVPHSRELGTFIVLAAAAASIWVMGGWLGQRAMWMTGKALSIDAQSAREPARMLPRLAEAGWDALFAVAPLLAVLLLAAIISPFLINGWAFSLKGPDITRMSPIAGIGRMFSWNSLLELGKAVLKILVVGGVGVLIIRSEYDEIRALLAQPLLPAIVSGLDLLVWSFLLLVATLLIIVAVDVPFQIFMYYHRLRMTKDEVKQEMKEMEGDPHVKGRIRSLQMQAARRRMMSAVPQADIIVTNPTHFSVALSYKTGMGAPKVVAKGMGELARKIREIGAEHGVPMVEAPPLARALYR
ncbi:MAG TPA: flagellar type III secretion system protein FlhB, partial [Rhodocyclaceae bacterium]|nr:flagellar type III secretion system protein FlhB [Rhodocyclaceae bacterium]